MFVAKNLSVIAYANGFTLWHYKSVNDKLEDICELGYFNKVMNQCRDGDLIIVSARDNNGIRRIEKVGDVWLRELK